MRHLQRPLTGPTVAEAIGGHARAVRMTYLVTGATGFVGGYLVRELRRAGHDVRAVVRTPARAGDLKQLGIALFEGDVTDKASMRAPMTGVDGVFHVAGWYKIGVRDKSPAARRQRRRHAQRARADVRARRAEGRLHEHARGELGHARTASWTRRTASRAGTSRSTTSRKRARITSRSRSSRRGCRSSSSSPASSTVRATRAACGRCCCSTCRRRLPAIPKQTAYAWGHVEDVVHGHVLAMEKGAARTQLLHLRSGAHARSGAGSREPRSPAFLRRDSERSPGGAAGRGAAGCARSSRFLPLPPAYTAEGLRIIAGVTYIGDNSRAKRELGWTVRPLREGLSETLRHEMKLLGMTVA